MATRFISGHSRDLIYDDHTADPGYDSDDMTSRTSITIAVDGACRHNGTRFARASYGVFVCSSSRYNETGLLRSRPTSQRAELVAAIRGLAIAGRLLRQRGESLETIIIKADSAYLVEGVTNWWIKWQKNKWRTANGTRVANLKLWWALLNRVRKLQNKGVIVAFWLVPREFNTEADGLAADALE